MADKISIGRDGSLVFDTRTTCIFDDVVSEVLLEESEIPERNYSKYSDSLVVEGSRKRIDSDFAMANAIRKAGDLREQTDDIRPFDGVMLWRDDLVYRFEVDYPDEDPDVEWDGRYYWARTDSSDVYEMSREEAEQMARQSEYVHLGSCTSLVEPVDAVPAEADRPLYGPRFLFTLIEFCCSAESRLCDDKYFLPGIRLVRLSLEHDLTTPAGLKYARSIINDPLIGL